MVVSGKLFSTLITSGNHWWWNFGAFTAKLVFCLKSITSTIAWKTDVGIVVPPGVPTTIFTLPSFRTKVGAIEDSILFPGSLLLASHITAPTILGTPGFTEKSSISLFKKNPAPETTVVLP